MTHWKLPCLCVIAAVAVLVPAVHSGMTAWDGVQAALATAGAVASAVYGYFDKTAANASGGQ